MIKIKLSDSIQYVKGIGEKRALLFHKLGIFTVRDLLYHLPRGFEDRTRIKDIADLIDGETVCVKGILASGVKSFRARNRGCRVAQTTLADETGAMRLTWFNGTYIEKTLSDPQAEYMFFGKVQYRTMAAEMVNPIIEKVDNSEAGGKKESKMGRIVPIYPATAGLNQQSIRAAVSRALDGLSENFPEPLPKSLREKYGLLGIDDAIRHVHKPKNYDEFTEARRRLVFEEFLKLQLGVSIAGAAKKSKKAVPIEDVKCISSFAAGLSFELTHAQKRVINEIAADLKKGVPMNRLVQGDVGSGKTIVAAAAMYAVAMAGYQSVMMAPTEILAEQHYASMKKYFEPYGIRAAFLSGGQSAADRAENLALAESGEAKVIIGTHAVITDKVEFNALALSITDEQHRFGVRQRSKLSAKGMNTHSLVMTATPIPRTLSLVIYGDLDISVIDELPPGRKPVKTFALNEGLRPKLYGFVMKELDAGRQAYFVCALVEDSDAVNAKSATEYVKKLKNLFPTKKTDLLHGRMKSFEKEEVMRRFASGETDILVSTTVIEVGVDVPNATIMVIENAERFGLSQLHQLRGRVGRGAEQSYCFMFGGSHSEIARERMKAMCATNDGFKIAERDLELRGPGEFFGTRQHGLPEMKIGNFFTDMEELKLTQTVSAELLKADPGLSSPELLPLRQSIEDEFARAGDIFN